MARRIVIASGKGGVGKTTVCIALGKALAGMQKKVLLLDFDNLRSIDLMLGAAQDVVFDWGDAAKGRCAAKDAVLEAGDIAAQIEHYSEPVMVIGDGTAILRESCEGFLEAPMHLRDQSACGIAMAAMRTEPVPPEALSVSYLQAVKIG